jgi:SAM-dependent methyltransferase
MLKDAALLHLDLLRAALTEGFTIKDGTAFNVQWVGQRPVYIDVASFERLVPGQSWAGYRQFCQTFLFPLFLQAYKNVAFQPLLRGCLDGLKPEEFGNLMSFRDLFRRGVLAHAYLHGKLEANRFVRETNPQRSLPRAGFDKALIQKNVAQLTRIINGLNWTPRESKWSAYAGANSYSPADKELKTAFVREAARAQRPLLVWDLGCNTGEYSRIAAESARYVISMDADHLAVDRLYQSLKGSGVKNGSAPILPLVSNVADPSANLGWRGQERKTLAERGRPDLILCLALVHHLVIGCGIPLRELLEWLAGLGASLVIEFVDKTDPMVVQLLGSRRDIYADYDPGQFDAWMKEYFNVVRCERLASGTRVLYYAISRCRL